MGPTPSPTQSTQQSKTAESRGEGACFLFENCALAWSRHQEVYRARSRHQWVQPRGLEQLELSWPSVQAQGLDLCSVMSLGQGAQTILARSMLQQGVGKHKHVYTCSVKSMYA